MSEKHRRMRREYCTGITVAIVLTLFVTCTFALVFGIGSTQKDGRIEVLQQTNAHLEAEVMELMMTALTFSTRYVQNGTCVFGFVHIAASAPQTLEELSDYVVLNYTLKEIYLTSASVPLTVLEISATPRPIVFTGYTPTITLTKYNDLAPMLSFFDPPIAQLDTAAQNFDLIPYSYVTASKIDLIPNCVAASSLEHDSSHCREENGFSPFYSSSYPSTNSIQIYPNNLETTGSAVLQFIWGQYSYADFGSQYDFTGTTVEFESAIQFLVPGI